MSRYDSCVCRGLASASLLLLAAVVAQGQTTLRAVRLLGPSSSSRHICMNVGAIEPVDARAFLRFSGSSHDLPEDVCGTLGREEWRKTPASPAPPLDRPVAERFATDLIEDELVTMGRPGLLIAAARQEVLQILREGNACSAWYAQKEPDPAEKFATLHFRVDSGGESTAHPSDLADGLYRQPYVARSQQNVGRGSFITFNAHGAFFQLRAPTDIWVLATSPFHPRFLQVRVGTYEGGSLKAQVTTMLHEYAHIVDLLPLDYGRAESARLSTQNTQTVLNHCLAQIEASPNRTITLPASLAAFERQKNNN